MAGRAYVKRSQMLSNSGRSFELCPCDATLACKIDMNLLFLDSRIDRSAQHVHRFPINLEV